MKPCSKCGQPIDGSHNSYCRKCHAAYQRGRYKWDRKRQVQQARYLYKITEEEAIRLLDTKECALCDKEATQIDHCHETGRVRGRLCAACNRGIGIFKDDPERLMAAAAYLQKTAL